LNNGNVCNYDPALRALQEDNARLQALADVRWFYQHPLPTLIVDQGSQRILDANEAALRQFRYERDHFLQTRFDALRTGNGTFRRLNYRPQFVAASNNPLVTFLRRDGSAFEAELLSLDMQYLGLPAQLVQILDVSGRLDVEATMREHERRYKWLVENVSETIWRVELELPVPVALPEDEQIDRIYRNAVLAEANQSMATTYGYGSPEAMLGLRLGELLPRAEPQNIDFLRKFIQSGYRLIDEESVEVDAQGRTKWFLNRLVGEVEAGRLIRAWGASADITERKLAEMRGRQFEQLWRDALDNVELIALFLDTEGKLTYVNPFFTTTSGWGLHEIVGRNWFTEVNRGFDEELHLYQQRLEGDAPPNCVGPLVTRAGSERQVRWNNTVLRGAQGRPLGMFCIGEDITDQLRTDAALRESEERYRRLVEGLSIGIYRSTPEGHLDFCNPAAARLFGLPTSDHTDSVNLETFSFGPGYDRQEFKRRLEAEGELRGTEVQWNTRPGPPFWVRESAHVIRDPAGRVRYYEGTIEDISEQKQGEQALKEREEHYRVLVQLSPVGTFMTRRGLIVSANRALTDLLGYRSPDELIGKHLLDLLHPSDREVVQAEYLAAPPLYGVLPVHERRILRKDGSAILVEAHVARVHVQNDRGSVIVVRDVTAERQAEQDRRRWQQRMLEMQKLESLGLLAGGLAHDFNNQLTVILGHLDLVRDSLPPASSLTGLLDPAEQAAKHSMALCQQMLSFSGRGKIEVGLVNLTCTIQDVETLLKVASAKKADLIYKLDESLPTIQAEEAQVRQVLINLVSNAAEAIADGPIKGKITIKTGVTTINEDYKNPEVTLELPMGEYVYLEVTDTGVGMDVNTRRRIFEPFFTTKPTGRGLGLPAVLGIVRSHGGAIEVSSRVRHGTTFRVFFPRRRPEPPPLVTERLSSAETEVVTPRRTVLLVEDEPSLRALAGKVLSTHGWNVIEAEDGPSAVDLLRERVSEIDAVLIDLALPGLDGVETLRQLWAIHPNLQAIAMSSYGTLELERRFAGFPLLGLLPKPFTPGSLLDALDHVKSINPMNSAK
jgi:PAS domain S-box-containing protein